MKHEALPIFLLSSLLLCGAMAAAASDAVLDTDGNALKRGTKYYILQTSPGKHSGLRLASRNGTCPLDVATARSEGDIGLPISFFPADEGEQTVRLSKDANFEFSAYTTCITSTLWQIRFREATNRYYVSTGGVPGNPGKDTLGNWFNINREAEGGTSDSYKLTYCPTVCDFCRPFCGDLGLFAEDGRNWLGLRGSPALSVVFKKA